VLIVFILSVAFLHVNIPNTTDQALYLQDIAIIGGLLYVSAYGAGAWSTEWPYKR
jgi:uncharacterized membrane protein YphA (DoxX/SURF4 family)